MANKDGDVSSQNSASTSDSEEVIEDEINSNAVSPIPPLEPQDQEADGTEAVDRFLEQVAGSAHTDGHTDSGSGKKEAADRQHAKCMTAPPDCCCQLNAGQPCHTRFNTEELTAMRRHYLTLSRKELDIAVLAKLECGIHLSDLTSRKKRKPTTRKKHRTDFYHRGFRICNVLFVYLHGFSYKKLKALILQYKTNGVRTRVHKNIKTKPAGTPDQSPSKKKKSKAKPKPKEPKAKKPSTKKQRKDNRVNNSKKGTTRGPVSLPCPKPPLPPSASLSQPTYPVTFPLTNPTHHHPPPAPLMPPTQPPGFPHSGGYVSGASVFPPQSLTVHTAAPHPRSVMSVPGVPHGDYHHSQLGLPPSPSLDCSGPRTVPHPGNSFPSTSGPCVTYSVVHSMAF